MKIKWVKYGYMRNGYRYNFSEGESDCDEYEIIEDDKKIDKIKTWNRGDGTAGWTERVEHKLDELVDVVNKLMEKK